MTRALQDNGLVGAVWATVTPDGGIVTGAAGVRDARTGQRMAPDDRVHIGSVTKTLLATGILRLVTEGRVTFATPVATILPNVAFDNAWSDTDPVRVRHLLDHTSGLDDARLWQAFSLQPTPDQPLSATFDGSPSLLRIRSRPGSRCSYSNMGYTLLGMVIEAVTGERYERYLDTHLLRPLGMYDSTFAFVTQIGPHADRRLAMGHFDDGTSHEAVPMFLRPASQFTTTAADMAQLARFLMSDGRIEGEAFIDADLLRAMGRPEGTEAADAGLRSGYGLGLATRDRHSVIGRCHGGNTVGYRAMLCLFHERQKAFFVSMNADNETADYNAIDALLVRSLEVQAPSTTVAAPPPPDIAEWEGWYALEPNRFASLAWFDTTLNFARVRWDGATLHLAPFQATARALSPAGGATFKASDRLEPSHVALTASDGRRLLSDGLQTYAQVSFTRLVPLWISLLAGMLGLAYVLVSGLGRLLMGRMSTSRPIFVPFIGVVALPLPLPLFFRQSFLAIGDVTAASLALAAVTAALPLAMLIGIVLHTRRHPAGFAATLDVVAMVALLQFAAVLAVWGLIPLRLWM